MQILFPRICQISIKFSIENKKSESYQIWLIELEEKFVALFPCSSFKAFGSSWKQMVLGINGWPHWPVITSCYHANEMAVPSKERRKREEWRICERLLVTQLNLRSSRTRSDVTTWWDWPDI